MQARATLAPRMYFCVDVVRKLFTDKPFNTLSGEKMEKKNKKKERESDVWNFPGL